MRLKSILLLSLLILSCQNQSEIARKPQVETIEDTPFLPINEEIISKAVLYEANIRQYSVEGSFNAFAEDLPKLKKMGVKIIWLMPINPISTTKSKGPLGSYYAVSNYTKVNPEFGTLKDFKSLVNKAHQLGMYVILDWVPGHTGWDHVWIKENSDYYLKNRKGEIIDPIDFRTGKSFGWTDVADLNYKNMQMREALRKAMVYWVEETNIDGYRIDQAYAVPQEFYNKTFAILKRIKPLFLLAETDIYHPGGLDLVKKFDASYDWPGHHLSKKVAQGQKNALNYSRHIERTIKRYGPENIVVNFVSNHDENSWNGTIEESYGKAAYAFMALNYTIPGMPLVYSGQEYDLNKRLHFFEKDSFPKVSGKTMEFLQQLGALKNNHKALTSGLSGGSFRRLLNSKNDQILAFERERDGDTIVFIANLSKDYAQFTLPYEGNFKRFQDFKNKRLSSSYQYDMKPWEFWILTN
ncbi:MAG: alpha-amylase family glycosyl hydrolase [Flavobacteriaceae bacterium]|nr:alpha-amylase family glycosyl hydrolase [Flavobacteriaceae bacterium]MDG2234688.1 alpha-amylase family glycosyl hydrolase [Flavobacteriaceae bacterium]|tara:strand:- start:487 stop:1887 length:1401 start_codon:yes stop_codon:yes gene_type:complete